MKKKIQLDEALQDLEKIVDQMESGDLPLEKSLETFEKGIALTRSCKEILTNAEKKISLLIQQDGQEQLKSYDDKEE